MRERTRNSELGIYFDRQKPLQKVPKQNNNNNKEKTNKHNIMTRKQHSFQFQFETATAAKLPIIINNVT